MDKNVLSPYIRLAIHSTISAQFVINTRVIYDYEIIYVKGGSCVIRIDNVDYILRKNNVVFLRPGIPHSFRVEDEDFVQPHIHFDAVYSENSKITPISFKAKGAMSDEEIKLIQKDVFENVNIPYVFVPDNSVAFQSVFFDIINLYSEGESTQLKLKSKMIELLDMILAQFEKSSQADNKISDKVIVNIKNYIDENYRNILTLDLLSKMFFINKFTLMRKFKNIYGINIIKYYNGKRAEASKDMLINTNMTVKEIGEILNFTDAYSFSRFFKSCVGVSPVQFRKK